MTRCQTVPPGTIQSWFTDQPRRLRFTKNGWKRVFWFEGSKVVWGRLFRTAADALAYRGPA